MAFDDNPLTFFDAEDPDNSWVGLAISAEEDLKEIQYIFRNDDNNIRIGDDYELFYWDNDMWNSLGFQKASNDFLEYNNCPTNTLFLLKNYSRGKEERIFTYENDEQIWW